MTHQRIPMGGLIATLIGNTLEFYDFLIYSFFSVYIGKAFFPTDDDFASLLLAGISIAYALTVTIFGATTQFVVAALIRVTEDPFAPAYYVMVTSAISIGAMLMLGETKDRA